MVVLGAEERRLMAKRTLHRVGKVNGFPPSCSSSTEQGGQKVRSEKGITGPDPSIYRSHPMFFRMMLMDGSLEFCNRFRPPCKEIQALRD